MRALGTVARARIENAWPRLGASALAALVTAAVFESMLAIYWLAGLILVILIDQMAYRSLRARVVSGRAGGPMPRLIAWCVAQSIYGNALAAILWFAPVGPGPTLAALFLCGSLANAAGTLRHSPALAAAAMSPAVGFLLGLPVADFLIGGGRDTLDLVPLIGALLLLAWGAKLWNSLLASDAALAHAEAAAMRERQAAASAAAAKSDMIKRVNDELRTPLAALAGAAERLRRSASTPAARDYVATLMRAKDVLVQALDDVSDLERVESGEFSVAPQSSDPREIAESVVSAFRTTAADKGIELFLDTASDLPNAVEIDAVRVRQILFNLVANAVRFTTYGGVSLRVSASPGRRNGHAQIVFAVADTGCGMSRSHLAIVLGRKGDGEELDGPGQGLAIAITLARLMGGEITAKSELGQGSLFTFVAEAPVAASRQPRTAA